MSIKGFFLPALLAAFLGWMAPASATQEDARLKPLFERLKKTPSHDEAEAIEKRIWEIWIEAPGRDQQVGRLMSQGMLALIVDDYPSALESFDRVIEREPDFAEAWNKRATVHYMMDDYESSVADIRQVLALEPRHFGALSGLGMIFLSLEQPDRALTVFEAALAINPHLEVVRQQVDAIRQTLAGAPT